MPKTIRELKQMFQQAGFTLLPKRGKGSHSYSDFSRHLEKSISNLTPQPPSFPPTPLIPPYKRGEDRGCFAFFARGEDRGCFAFFARGEDRGCFAFFARGEDRGCFAFFARGEDRGCFAFVPRKGENSKPLSLQERGLERGFPDPDQK
jgi:hypothetical protein